MLWTGTVTFFFPVYCALQPESLLAHAASLRQGFPHCARFLTAASRRSLDRVSVPVWPITLSGRLLIVAMVSRYPTIKLISRRPIPEHRSFYHPIRKKDGVWGISPSFPGLSPTQGQVAYVLLTRSPLVYPEGPYRTTCMFKTRRQR